MAQKPRNIMKSLRVKDFLQIDGLVTGNGIMPGAKDKIWYVWEKKDSAKTGSGHNWDDAFLTLGEAITAAGDNDYILVGPGSYDEGDSITITQDYLTIIGTNSNNNMHEAYVYGSSATKDLLIVKGDKLRVYNLAFNQTKAKACVVFGDTDGQAFYQALFDGCKFEGNGTGTYGFLSGGTLAAAGNVDAPDITIRNCHFRGLATAAIQMNWTRAKVYDNTFICDAGSIAIEYLPTSGNRPDSMIYDNKILGVNSTDTGIKITNSPSAGLYFIAGNLIANTATTITGKATNDAVCILNYTGDASGGALIDPSP